MARSCTKKSWRTPAPVATFALKFVVIESLEMTCLLVVARLCVPLLKVWVSALSVGMCCCVLAWCEMVFI